MELKNTTSRPDAATSANMIPDQPIFKSLDPDQHIGLPDPMRTLMEENRQLREQLVAAQAHVARLEKTEREVMNLLKTPAREKIVHDLRNVLNELVLLQAIAGHDD
jgi:hypothetical protein